MVTLEKKACWKNFENELFCIAPKLSIWEHLKHNTFLFQHNSVQILLRTMENATYVTLK